MNTLPVSTNGLNHDKKLQERKYYTLVLSDIRVEGGLDYRCYKCGRVVFTIYNSPKAGFTVKVPFEDISTNIKVTEGLCKTCNIMYRVA